MLGASSGTMSKVTLVEALYPAVLVTDNVALYVPAFLNKTSLVFIPSRVPLYLISEFFPPEMATIENTVFVSSIG